ncbi:MAG: glutamine-hydrolyzing carbamoyl-phosphate synthase small subunit [Candidatus Omnitrophica bacterium]|nr:glutamine-hydrolyzing carbamoyl-phosphate synthase small subunit [Candidatus Omnitrophota bacterium]
MKEAVLYLEDGTCFRGRSLNTHGDTAGEVVFNTALTGYQEVLTDPSYAGQIVVMTYPLIGNYGVNDDDVESDRIHVKGFVVKEFCRTHSNYRATKSLIQYLDEGKIIGIEGVDTRALTRHLRISGAMKAIISTEDFDLKSLKAKLDKVPSMEGADWVKEVAPKKPYVWKASGEKKYKVVVVDCGIKRNILREMAVLGIECHVVPPSMSAEDILAMKADGLFLSSGPGDPAAVTYVIETVRKLIGKLPIFGICLGNQMIGLALGGKTYKLKFGHHGGNHPVKDLENDRISITSQNHGFCVDVNSLDKNDVEAIHINLNDKSVEGLRHRKHPLFSIQYHPEACPGPNDAKYLFGEFIKMIDKNKK